MDTTRLDYTSPTRCLASIDISPGTVLVVPLARVIDITRNPEEGSENALVSLGNQYRRRPRSGPGAARRLERRDPARPACADDGRRRHHQGWPDNEGRSQPVF